MSILTKNYSTPSPHINKVYFSRVSDNASKYRTQRYKTVQRMDEARLSQDVAGGRNAQSRIPTQGRASGPRDHGVGVLQ